MKIEKEKREQKVTTENAVARFSKEDIRTLLEQELKKRGFKPAGKWYFKTNWKYVSDEWGMNRSVATSFEGVSVDVEKEDE